MVSYEFYSSIMSFPCFDFSTKNTDLSALFPALVSNNMEKSLPMLSERRDVIWNW
eukprot:TRINITY_DN8294_c0_g1_i1.p4 TRINITY_DN8294_c0_g1~~TRINITY_DN8294_c0_g1_i1.p4  ORF type:complete len:63 (+),score=8.87 TRINITY_DN8294_c0_g1_i1:25-189(+)